MSYDGWEHTNGNQVSTKHSTQNYTQKTMNMANRGEGKEGGDVLELSVWGGESQEEWYSTDVSCKISK